MTKEKVIYHLRGIAEFALLGAIFILPFSKALLDIFLGVAFVTWFLSKLFSREPLCLNPKLFFLLGLFLMVSSVSAFGSGYPMLSARGILKLIRFVLVFLLAFDFFEDPKKLKRLLIAGAVSLSLVLFDSFAQLILGYDLVAHLPVQFTGTQQRATGPFTFYGLLATMLIAVMPILIELFLRKKLLSLGVKIICMVLFVLSGILLYKTHSRGAWVASLSSWVVFAILMRKKMLLVCALLFLCVLPFLLTQNAL